MDARSVFSEFDLSKVVGGLETLRPIQRDGNHVTYASFLFVGKSAIVEVKRLVVEFPTAGTHIDQEVSGDSVVFTAVAPMPRIVEVEFGKVLPIAWEG